jgi:hypothetical protein
MSLPFRKLGLGGGGVKGILHIGAIQELQKHQPLDFPEGIYGCSIGAIVATTIAFNMPFTDEKVKIAVELLDLKSAMPTLTFQDVFASFAKKGVFNMDSFETLMTKLFSALGLDIVGKKIGDAPQPLYIIASNITKGVPTIFTKDVLIMDALKCSCCIPLMFMPEQLYGQLYLDGGLFVPSLSTIFKDGLQLFLTKTKYRNITPATIESISPINYVRQLISTAEAQSHRFNKTEDTVELEYPKLMYDSDLKEFDTQDILRHAATLMRLFLVSKGLLQELTEVSNIGPT